MTYQREGYSKVVTYVVVVIVLGVCLFLAGRFSAPEIYPAEPTMTQQQVDSIRLSIIVDSTEAIKLRKQQGILAQKNNHLQNLLNRQRRETRKYVDSLRAVTIVKEPKYYKELSQQEITNIFNN